MTCASIYPLYANKALELGRTEAELREVILWLTGFTQAKLDGHIKRESTIAALFDDAELNPDASLTTGVICGYRVEEIENPPTQSARYTDKLVDELARSKKMESVLRS